jgi:hypothetical protein
MNFISNDLKDLNKDKDKDGLKNTSYDTIGKDSSKESNSNKNSSNPSHSDKSKNTYLDVNGNMSSKDNPNLNDDLNNSDSLSNYIEKETNERIGKLVRFGVDYCRASPNITLKTKTLLNIGWRAQKFNYDVEYEIVNFKGEKAAVRKI